MNIVLVNKTVIEVNDLHIGDDSTQYTRASDGMGFIVPSFLILMVQVTAAYHNFATPRPMSSVPDAVSSHMSDRYGATLTPEDTVGMGIAADGADYWSNHTADAKRVPTAEELAALEAIGREEKTDHNAYALAE